MTYGWARDFALELINQYSVAGSVVRESYNNQADYVARIPKLVDDAQLFLATNEGRIRELRPLAGLERRRMGDWTMHQLPPDCWQMCGGGLVRLDGPSLRRFDRYRLLGGGRLLIPPNVEGVLAVEYFRYPRPVGLEPSDDAELDNTPQAQQAIPYYVAAHLVMYDDPFAYASLFNEFEQKRALLREEVRCELEDVEDVYGLEMWDF